jgi:putative acetyltransferase
MTETLDVDLVVGGDQADARDVAAMVASHRAWTMRHSPPEHCHSLDQQRAVDPAVTFFGARRGGKLVGVGALRHLDDGHVELKSMHVDAAARGAGVGRAILQRLLVEAAERGYRRVSLETGTMEAFAPARALYESAGFLPGPPFGDYTDNPYSACMTLELG